ncbi:twin-arginine translocation signal domain-containing protein [Lelliottia amnigena]|nr:twin-arginine translocation signal domain-containing protein [Lelliottia amnigena]
MIRRAFLKHSAVAVT